VISLSDFPQLEVKIMGNRRTELQQEVVEALITSKAVDFEAVGKVLSKYGARAARAGDGIGVLITWRLHDICIPPEPYLDLGLERAVGQQAKG
jgi:hypothetical protein